MHGFQIGETAGAFRDGLDGAFQDARMGDDLAGKGEIAHRMGAQHRRDRFSAGAAEQAVDLQIDRRARRAQFALCVEADDFQIGAAAGGADFRSQSLQVLEGEADILETDMAGTASQHILEPRAGIGDGPVIGRQHEDEIERHQAMVTPFGDEASSFTR